MPYRTPPSAAAHFFIVLFLLSQVALSIRCYFVKPKFFGWQMFSAATVYQIEFYGVDRQGVRKMIPKEDYQPWFGGKAYYHAYLLPEPAYRVFSRGREWLLEQGKLYPKFLCTRLKERGYKIIEIHIKHRTPPEIKMSQTVYQEICAAGEPG